MKKLFGILLLIFIALPSKSQLLWKISGKGLSHPSYIFGTHHLAKLSIIDSIKGLKPAFESAQQIIGEVDMKDMQAPATMQLMQKKMMIDNDTTLRMLFTPTDYEKVNKCVKENLNGADLSLMQKVRPVFLSNNLEVILYLKQMGDFNIQEQLDSYFQKEGLAKGKKVIPLETIEQQFDILFNSASLRRQAELLVCMIDNIKKEAEQTLALNAFYKYQKLDAMYKLSLENEGNNCDPRPEEMENLIYRRNKTWVTKLPSLMKAAPSFIAVGALHLPGPHGVLILLKKAGYTVQPVW
jgi:uncharacterized protein YbaP (TraB family)